MSGLFVRRCLATSLLICGIFWIVSFQLRPRTPADAAARIRTVYTKHIDRLDTEKQGHFILRLYRTSQNPAYIPMLENYGRFMTDRFQKHVAQLDHPEYAMTTGREFLRLSENSSEKHILRANVLLPKADMLFASRLAFYMTQIQSLHLEENLKSDFQKAESFLASLPWSEFLLNPEIIRAYGSRTSNTVYYLKNLGIVDLESDYTKAFKRAFQTSPVTRTVLLNEIYGLTHIIIGDSQYYQHTVSPEKHAWILTIFRERLSEIIKNTTPDVIAEVGICFRLTGSSDDPALVKIQDYLRRQISPWRGIIVSPSSKKLARLEHRNAVAYLAMSDYKNFYPGPDLSSSYPSKN